MARPPVSRRCEKRLVKAAVIERPAVKRWVRVKSIVKDQTTADQGADLAARAIGTQVPPHRTAAAHNVRTDKRMFEEVGGARAWLCLALCYGVITAPMRNILGPTVRL